MPSLWHVPSQDWSGTMNKRVLYERGTVREKRGSSLDRRKLTAMKVELTDI